MCIRDRAHQDAVARLDQMTRDLAQPAPSTVAVVDSRRADAILAEVTSSTTEAGYLDLVESAKEAVSYTHLDVYKRQAVTSP